MKGAHKVLPSERIKNLQIIDPVFDLSELMSPMEELDAMILAGYGDTPQVKIPRDWKEKPGPRSTWFRKW